MKLSADTMSAFLKNNPEMMKVSQAMFNRLFYK